MIPTRVRVPLTRREENAEMQVGARQSSRAGRTFEQAKVVFVIDFFFSFLFFPHSSTVAPNEGKGGEKKNVRSVVQHE